MKIRLSELRRIIREAIVEQGWVPGRWYPDNGEPVSDKKVGTMDSDGMGCGCDHEEELEEGDLDEDSDF